MVLKSFVESAMRILKGGNVRSSSNLHENDVKASLARAIAFLVKKESVTQMDGTTVPDYLMVGTYEDIPVVAIDDDHSYALIPVPTVNLGRSKGIMKVAKTGCYDFIVPLEPGMMSVAQKVNHTALAAILDSEIIAYEPHRDRVTFNRSKEQMGDTVYMHLVVTDVLQLDDYSQLPIPQDMEGQAMQMVLAELQGRPHDNQNDGVDAP
jgi:hypothetical protein